MIEAVGLAVHGNRGAGGLILAQQALDGNPGIADVFLAGTAQLIAHFAAIAIDAKPHIIHKEPALSGSLHNRQVFQIGIKQNESVLGLVLHIVHKIIAGTARSVVNWMLRRNTVQPVNKMMNRAIAAQKNDALRNGRFLQKPAQILRGHVQRAQGLGTQLLGQLLGFGLAIAGKGIVKNVDHVLRLSCE